MWRSSGVTGLWFSSLLRVSRHPEDALPTASRRPGAARAEPSGRTLPFGTPVSTCLFLKKLRVSHDSRVVNLHRRFHSSFLANRKRDALTQVLSVFTLPVHFPPWCFNT